MLFIRLLLLISFIWCPTARGKLQAHCSSGMTVLEDQNSSALLTLTGRLSNDTNLQPSCILKADKPNSFLRVRARRNDNSNGKKLIHKICNVLCIVFLVELSPSSCFLYFETKHLGEVLGNDGITLKRDHDQFLTCASFSRSGSKLKKSQSTNAKRTVFCNPCVLV